MRLFLHFTKKDFKRHASQTSGGGNAFVLIAILALPLILSNLHAVEVSDVCVVSFGACQVDNPYQSLENNKELTTEISINADINTFINRGTMPSIYNNNGGIGNFYNYGRTGARLEGGIGGIMNIYNYGYLVGLLQVREIVVNIENRGTIGGIQANSIGFAGIPPTININNFGTINVGSDMNMARKGAHFLGGQIRIKNYAIKIIKDTNSFNGFSGVADYVTDNSHILTNLNTTGANPAGIAFYDDNSRLILDFGENFEFGSRYALSKLVVHYDSGANSLPVDFYRLSLHNPDIYRLTQSGDYFIVNELSGGEIHTPITESNKNNVAIMNNFFLQSNAMIYRQKIGAQRLSKRKRTLQRRVIRKKVSLFRHSEPLGLDSSLRASHYAQNDEWANPLESNEIFFYDSQMYLADNQRQTRTIRTRNLNTTNPSANPSTKSTNPSTIHNPNSDKYYFILTPYINHNLYFKAGNYNLSGLDGGFITAFSGKISPSNYLGTHFGFSYGNLSDKGDKAFSIKSANLMLGLNYKFDMIWNMYLKARGDFYCFINEISSASVATIKPNNLGFGVSASYGKDFNFGSGGVLGAELGIDYKALSANTLNVKSALNNSVLQDYDKALYNLIYLDLGANYHKYFGNFGLNGRLGIRGNLAPKLAKSKLIVSNKSLDILIDNDKFAGYISIGGSYVLNAKDFDMEFSLAFNGIYGDRAMSNGGSLEWRVSF